MINRYLDHAILVPQMTRQEVIEWILSGIKHKVKTVCVRPCDISLAVEMCRGTETEVSCVLGFPHGNACTETKMAEAKLYCKKGVAEIDMVANYGWIRSRLWDEVCNDIEGVVNIAHSCRYKPNRSAVLVKVILETSQLTCDEIIKATEICIDAHADFVKTSTGFNGEGAKEDDIRNIMKTAAGRIKIKPSGGIRDQTRAQMFIDMGVDRLGVNGSSTPNICSGIQNSNEKVGY
ncbi:MAG: deoxyribose-phosphate aldolase [Planctomycetaceae bacterium]|jgi:deoxyribose-phosphate aldolase|nr:deoxyribose-phosphate aldolase [Planctomycetaceae bacterium]